MGIRNEVASFGTFLNPTGAAADHVVITFTAANPANTQSSTIPAASFPVAPAMNVPVSVTLAADTYTITGQTFDAAGNQIGPTVTDPNSPVVVTTAQNVTILVTLSGINA